MEAKRAKTGRKWAKDCHLLIFEIACFNSLSVQLRLVLRLKPIRNLIKMAIAANWKVA